MHKNKKLRMTRQRRVILEEMQKTRAHPTADQVYEKVRKKIPHISLGTVYRNLETLSENGLLVRMEKAGSRRRYDPVTHEHFHVRCIECGRLDDIYANPEIDLPRDPDKTGGYEIKGILAEFQGLCPSCKSKGDKNRQHKGG